MLCDWVLPILISFLAVIVLFSILLNNPRIKSKFSDLGALIQLQTSRPVYYPAYFNIQTDGGYVSTEDPNPIITTNRSSIYNYYPVTPVNPYAKYTEDEIKKMKAVKQVDNLAFVNAPVQIPRSDLVAYYGSVPPYYFPGWIYPATNMDKVRGVEERVAF